MNRILSFGIAAMLLATPVFAHDHAAHDTVAAGSLEISGAFTRATNPGAPVAGGYFSVTNNGDTDDRLVAVEANISERVEIHEMTMVNDVMNMRELPDGLPVPAGETVNLAPGGYHLMFMNLTTSLVEGETVDVVLVFEEAGEVPVTLSVESAGARSASGHNAHGH
ncbi:copper chaperone PCu(A)C [Pelagibacterium lentulum]|uniref:Copper chaperone PCu(A)C n=1 Tax=Pelagibacterium lentulum TaxID=2029865 RepID=A0A916VXE9_9HYPH|nr:copper chaperone PCu(A)C [Pelagibacterium lentulum]GGA49461.1 hypothetical protein GCM10011499_19170 [Pelagibacterium lentulum]